MKQIPGDIDWASPLDPLDAWLQFKSTFQDTLNHYIPTYKPKERKACIVANSDVFCLKKKKNHL